jgi:nitronate monooxygenase
MQSKSLKIGTYQFEKGIIQAGMGVGITLNKMAIAASKAGVVPVIALVGTNYYIDKNIPKAKDFTSRESIFKLIHDVRLEVGQAPIFCNIMCALSDYENIVKNAIEAGYNGIICGAGFQDVLPELVDKYSKPWQSIAIIPIVNHRAFPLLMRTWKKKYGKTILPDAVILEGPKSGGHQGYKLEEIDNPEFQLEVTTPKVLGQIQKYGNIPLIVAGGIMFREDVKYFENIGCYVQVGTRFLMTHESDASDFHKQAVINAKKEDITIGHSPAGYPCRKIDTQLQKNIIAGTAPEINCKSNCLTNCNHGEVAKKLGYCIADELGRAYQGDPNGLYFIGARGYEINEIISVDDLVNELTTDISNE